MYVFDLKALLFAPFLNFLQPSHLSKPSSCFLELCFTFSLSLDGKSTIKLKRHHKAYNSVVNKDVSYVFRVMFISSSEGYISE